MSINVICEDTRQAEAQFDTEEEANIYLASTHYPVARWIEYSN